MTVNFSVAFLLTKDTEPDGELVHSSVASYEKLMVPFYERRFGNTVIKYS
jgi:hypothetical protein